MNSFRNEDGKPNFRTFENYGFLYGLAVGLVVGVIVAGPHFKDWSLLSSLATIIGCGIGIGFVGHIGIAMAYGSTASGFGISDIGSGSYSSDDGGGHGCHGGDGGGDGSC